MSEIANTEVQSESQEPVEGVTQETTEVVETVEPVSTETAEAPASGESAETEEEKAAAEKVTRKNSFQERINTKTRQANEATQRAEDAEKRAALAEKQVTELMGDPGEFPTLESFDYDQMKYQEAVIKYNATLNQQTVQQAMLANDKATAQLATQEAQKAVVETFTERSQAFAEDTPDYQATVSNPALPIGKVVAQTVVHLENGPAVMYHLGKNPQLAAEISGLPAIQQVMRVGQLSERLSVPVAPIQTNAPAPAKVPVQSGSADLSKDPETMTPMQYAKWRGKR